MDQGTYTFEQLAKQNDNFTGPGFDILVDGKEMSRAKYCITSVEIEICGGGSVGGCTFQLAGQYDYEKKKWLNDATSIIKPGAKLVVNGGYQKRKELFYGFVDDYTIAFTEDEAPFITVSGLDGLGYLMNMCEPMYAGEKKPKQIVQTVLQKSVSAGFSKKITVGALDGFETPIIKEQTDDWRFLCMMAERYGATLLDVDGELIFDTLATKTAPIMTLTVGKSIRHFSKRVSLAHQVGAVEVIGRDINQKPVKGTANSVTVGGSGKIAAEWVSGLKSAVLRERSEFAQTQEECKKLAQNRFNSICMGFVSGAGESIGIPEMIPGRYIKIDGADEKTVGTYFITKVCHRFLEDRYATTFEVKGAKA